MNREQTQLVIEITEYGQDFQEIIDKYGEDPDLYQELDTVRRDVVKLRAMCFYFGPRVAILDAHLEDATVTRKRKKSGLIRYLLGETDEATGKKFNVGSAEHEARVRLSEIDQDIANMRKAANFGRSMLYNVREFIHQLTECMRSVTTEMRMTRND